MVADKKIIQMYRAHKQSAKQRKIPFLFSLEEWCFWWFYHLGSDWFEKRGRCLDQYNMARIGDKGGYVPWGVECITSRQNNHDRMANEKVPRGERVGTSKLTEEQVKVIRTVRLGIGTTKALLAKKYGVSYAHVKSIRQGHWWKHI